MTTDEYLATLDKLGLAPYAQSTCEALGLGQAQIARLANGEARPTRTLIKLLRLYLRFGVPKGI
jgi:hypothetical protein